MDNKHKVIHEFDLTLIGDFFKDLNRQGPGSEEVTHLALHFAEALNKDVRIADIGCGTGGQTFLLAKYTDGTIEASDFMPEFVTSFQKKIDNSPYADRINLRELSMLDLPYKKEEFDVLWAEGSIYNIGYKKGLHEFKKFLKPGGFIAVSEASWFTESQPEEIFTFWNNEYPEIDHIGNKVKQMEEAGYKAVAHFILPEECWWNYFNPIKAHIPEFLNEYPDNKQAKELTEQFEGEIALYEKYHAYYGYVFYIGQKI